MFQKIKKNFKKNPKFRALKSANITPSVMF